MSACQPDSCNLLRVLTYRHPFPKRTVLYTLHTNLSFLFLISFAYYPALISVRAPQTERRPLVNSVIPGQVSFDRDDQKGLILQEPAINELMYVQRGKKGEAER